MTEVILHRLPHGEGLPLPTRASAGAAGVDLAAACNTVIKPGAWVLIPTGFAIALPTGVEAQVRPRSGLALRYGITVLNAPGTIDADYRGEIGVILINHGAQAFRISRGDRIAQLVIAPVMQADFREGPVTAQGGRGTAGFGSTGVSDPAP